MHKGQRAGWLVVLAAGLTAGTGLAQKPYTVVDHWKIGGTGGWDSVVADGENHLLYLTHTTRVEVVDTRTGKLVGAVTGLKGAHGVSLDPDGEVGYISDGGANSIVAFDRRNYATLDAVPAGTDPNGIAFEPVTRTVWAFNRASQNVTVMDTRDRAVLETVKLPGAPRDTLADKHGAVYVTMADTNNVLRLNAVSRKVTATWTLDGCASPGALAYDDADRRLFAVCDGGKMAVVDVKAGKVIATAATGKEAGSLVYAPRAAVVLSSNGDGTLTVVDARPRKNYAPLQTLPTAPGARTMAYQEREDRVFLATAELGEAPAAPPPDAAANPAAPAAAPAAKPSVVPDSFTVLVVGRK